MCNTYLAHGLMLAAGFPIPHSDPQRSEQVPVAQRGQGDLGCGPDGVQSVIDLVALPHHGVHTVLADAVEHTLNNKRKNICS